MKNLLIVTDHRFYEYDNEIYDNYVFDYSFFKDYLSVFDKITIVCRVKKLKETPNGYLMTTGPNLDVIKIDDERGTKWFFFNKALLKRSNIDLSKFDAICYRIPSVLSFSIWSMVKKNKRKPQMFEMIGHPTESLQFGGSYVKRFLLSLIGKRIHESSKNIVNTAVCGSYVTFNSLQKKYPVNATSISESISSIRLEGKYIKSELLPFNSTTISIIHVGSFVPIKNHEFLLAFLKIVKDKYNVKLTFLGGGELLQTMIDKGKADNLEDLISFKGHVVGFDNIVQELDDNNVFILPSHSEGMPRAMIEAMARGLVCFGSKRGGIAELLSEDYLFDPLDVNTLVEKFENSIKDLGRVEKDRISNLEKVKLFEKQILTDKRIKLLTYLKKQTDE